VTIFIHEKLSLFVHCFNYLIDLKQELLVAWDAARRDWEHQCKNETIVHGNFLPIKFGGWVGWTVLG